MTTTARAAGLIALLVSALAGCTDIHVRPLAPELEVRQVCILENPAVVVPHFVDVLRDGFQRHGIDTDLYSEIPESCRFHLTYTARRSWDITTYLSYAELNLFERETQVAYAELVLRYKGGYDLGKYRTTATKMKPVIDQLLQDYDLRENTAGAPE